MVVISASVVDGASGSGDGASGSMVVISGSVVDGASGSQ